MWIVRTATAFVLLFGWSGTGCASDQDRQGMSRADVTSGGCAAVIWMPPLQEEHTQKMLESLLNESLKIDSMRQAAAGEARDTGDAYVCFRAVPGQESTAVEAIKLFIKTDLPDAGLEVLGPF